MLKTICLLVVVVVAAVKAGYCPRTNMACEIKGSALSKGKLMSLSACQKSCDKNAECRGIQYSVANKGLCFLLKKRCLNEQLIPKPGSDNYARIDKTKGESCIPNWRRKAKRYCKRVNIDCPGNDITRLDNVKDADLCQYYCDFNPKCASIEYVITKTCFIKHRACYPENAVPNERGINLVKIKFGEKCGQWSRPSKKYCPRPEMDCEGHITHSLGWVPNAKQCQELCSWSKKCKSVAWSRKINACYLRSRACFNDKLVYKPNIDDYVKISPNDSCNKYKVDYNFQWCDRPGYGGCPGAKTIEKHKVSFEKCKTLCAYKKSCKAVMYQIKQTICYLVDRACVTSKLQKHANFNNSVKRNRGQKCKKVLASLS